MVQSKAKRQQALNERLKALGYTHRLKGAKMLLRMQEPGWVVREAHTYATFIDQEQSFRTYTEDKVVAL